MFEIKAVTPNLIDDLARIFGTTKNTADCWCMWNTIPVKEFHANGAEGNRALFSEQAEKSELPMGVLAYQDGEPVGWCSVGPRSRFPRAIKTPTYRGGPEENDDAIWLVTCFYVKASARGAGVGKALLEAAVRLAEENNAKAIEGFPYSSTKKRSGSVQVGFEPMFASCGFRVVRTPSDSRVVMRRDLNE
jgi:GNAT superfamily N-acetyltransferase